MENMSLGTDICPHNSWVSYPAVSPPQTSAPPSWFTTSRGRDLVFFKVKLPLAKCKHLSLMGDVLFHVVRKALGSRMGCAEWCTAAWEREGVGTEVWSEEVGSGCPMYGNAIAWTRLLRWQRCRSVWDHAAGQTSGRWPVLALRSLWPAIGCARQFPSQEWSGAGETPPAAQQSYHTVPAPWWLGMFKLNRVQFLFHRIFSPSATISFPDRARPPDTQEMLVIAVHQHFSHKPTQRKCTHGCQQCKNLFAHHQQADKSGLDILSFWHV